MDWHKEMRRVHREALDKRAELPFEGHQIPFLMRAYARPDAPQRYADLVEPCGLDEQTLFSISRSLPFFRVLKQPAVLICADSRRVLSEEFNAYFGLGAVTDADECRRQYAAILKQHGGEMKYLPREVWKDAIMTAIKGPEIVPMMIETSYWADAEGRIVYGETREGAHPISNVLPDWWDTPIQ